MENTEVYIFTSPQYFLYQQPKRSFIYVLKYHRKAIGKFNSGYDLKTSMFQYFLKFTLVVPACKYFVMQYKSLEIILPF